MPDQCFALFRVEEHPYPLGARTAEAELEGELVAEGATDEEERLPFLHRWLELAVSGGRTGWDPGGDVVGLSAPRPECRRTSLPAEL